MSGRKGKGNGREDVLVISQTSLRQDYIKKNRSGLQRGKGGWRSRNGRNRRRRQELDEVLEAPMCGFRVL